MQTCKCCGESFAPGYEVIYEGYSGDYFCDEGCYRRFVRENIEDYYSYVEQAMGVGVTTLEEDLADV